MNSKALLSFVPVILILVSACSPNPTAREVVDQSTPVICEKTKECNGEALFAAAFPGGIDECVTKTKAELKKKYGDDLETRASVCTEEEVDKCLQDFKAVACPTDGSAPPVPCNC